MTIHSPQVYFYLPKSDWRSDMPDSADVFWPGYKYNCPAYDWAVQTYLRLRADDFPCELIDTPPTEGILIAYRSSLPDELRPGPNLAYLPFSAPILPSNTSKELNLTTWR